MNCDHTEPMVDQTLLAWSEVMHALPTIEGVG
jgi:hypothetical protein